jgi:transcriptional regulator with XRE-family HTH domain
VGLREERKKRGWSLTRLSGLTGIAATDLSMLERGLRSIFPGWRARIARAFGLPSSALFSAAAIRAYMQRGELIEGTHYFRTPGRGKRPGRPIFKWSAIEAWIERRQPGHALSAEAGTDIVPLRRRA